MENISNTAPLIVILGGTLHTLKTYNPFSAPADFRAYAYTDIVLVFETKSVRILEARYNKQALHDECGLHVLKLCTSDDVQSEVHRKWSPDEFLVFYNDGRGYECLFKRLRDSFAHGHFCSLRRGWITIRHQYKRRNEKIKTRLFGNMKIQTLKKLVAFLAEPTKS